MGRYIAENAPLYEPSGDWEARVWARIAREGESKARSWRWLFWALPSLGAAAAALFLWLPSPQVGPASLAVSVLNPADGLRGDAPHVGHTITVVASAGGQPHAELRVYRGDTLVHRCAADCRNGEVLRTELRIPAIGTYTTVLITGAGAAPKALGLDADAAAVRAAGLELRVSAPTEVF